jgi:hypothetical protein
MYHKVALAAMALTVAACGAKSYRTAAAADPWSQPVVSGSFVVNPRSYTPFKIVVENGMNNPRVEGTFSASGANNDIEVLLLEESQYLNWQNRHQFRAAYQSGRVTADRLKVELPTEPATYFLIFNNRFSLISNKGIVADLKLRCDRG